MRKFLASLFVVLIFFIPISSASSWYYVGKTNMGTESLSFYIDNDSVFKNSSNAILWVKVISSDGFIFLNKTAYNRYKHTVQTLEGVAYNPDGTINNYFIVDDSIRSIIPDSMDDAIYCLIW